MWLWELVGGAIITILFAFAGMIWRNLEGRVQKMETKDDATIDNLLKHPILTVDIHQTLCDRTKADMKTFFEVQTNILLQKLDETEKRTGLLIENAILKAFNNGKNGTKKVKK